MQLFSQPLNWGGQRTLGVLQRTSPFFYTENTTIANTIDETGDAMGAARNFTHVFMKGSGIASYSAVVAGSTDSAFTSFSSNMRATVTDLSGHDNSTVIGDLQHDLKDVRDLSLDEDDRDPRDGKTVNFTFVAESGATVRVYELMILNQLVAFEDVEIDPVGQPELLGGIRSSIFGNLHKVPVLGGKEKRENISLTVQSRQDDPEYNTLTLKLEQIFTKHLHFVCAVEYERFPYLVFPALVQPQLERRFLNNWKGAGKRLGFQITER